MKDGICVQYRIKHFSTSLDYFHFNDFFLFEILLFTRIWRTVQVFSDHHNYKCNFLIFASIIGSILSIRLLSISIRYVTFYSYTLILYTSSLKSLKINEEPESDDLTCESGFNFMYISSKRALICYSLSHSLKRGDWNGRILRVKVTVKTNGGSCLGMLSRYEDGNEIIR